MALCLGLRSCCSLLQAATSRETGGAEKTAQPTVIIKPKHPVLTAEQRAELGFPGGPDREDRTVRRRRGGAFFHDRVRSVREPERRQGLRKRETGRLQRPDKKLGRADPDLPGGAARQRVPYLQKPSGYGSLPDIVTVSRETIPTTCSRSRERKPPVTTSIPRPSSPGSRNSSSRVRSWSSAPGRTGSRPGS